MSRLSKIMQKITAQFDVTEFWKAVIRSVLTEKMGASLKTLEKVMNKNVSLKAVKGMLQEVLDFDLDEQSMQVIKTLKKCDIEGFNKAILLLLKEKRDDEV